MRIIRKIRSLLPAGQEPDGGVITEIEEYKKSRGRRRRRMLLLLAGVLALLILLVWIAASVIARWHYEGYRVLQVLEQEDTLSTSYVAFGDGVLKISSAEVSYLNRQGDALWKEAQSMNNPQTDICGEYCVVYDKNSTQMTLYTSAGKQGEIQTDLPILKARTASQGVTAAILADGENTWINMYDKDGGEIVSGKTRVDSPGYPVDLDISEDGILLAVSYMTASDGNVVSYMAFYNFGENGQNQMDNLVSGYTYEGVLTPAVSYLDDFRLLALRDDGFAIYRGRQIPEETAVVTTDEEIIGAFSDDSHIGLVFQETEGDTAYRIELYSASGKKLWSTGTDLDFDQIGISNDMILLCNSSQLGIYTLKGNCRYEGDFQDGSIRSVTKTGRNRYLVVTDQGLKTIKLT